MGEHIQVGMAANRAKGIIEVHSCQCLIIEIGIDLGQATTVLQSHVPADAMVFLITDAPLDEVASVRAALPTPENIIDEVKVDDSVDVIAPPVYRALQNMLAARPVTPTAADSHLQRMESTAQSVGVILQGYPQAFQSHLSGQSAWLPIRRPFASPSAAAELLRRPATAGNPTTALSTALDLVQGFCESPEWQRLAQTQDLSLLATLVTRALQETKNPNLKPMLRRLVEEMAVKPSLAERVFVVLQGGNESCVDRVSLALSKAEEEWIAQPVWDGALNQDLPKVLDIARQVFRRRCIDLLAQEKVEAMPGHTEEVETHLAYLAGLHESLGLGGEKPDAKFTDSIISGVTPEDIDIAKLKVLEQEGKRFWEFLATWKPWQRVVLRAIFPDKVARIEEMLSDPDRPARLEREAATAVENANVPPEFRQDAITRAVNQRGQDEELQLWLPLTRKAWSNQ